MKKMQECLFRLLVIVLVMGGLSIDVMADDTDVSLAGFASFVYSKTISGADEGSLDGMTAEGSERDFNTLGLRMDADMGNKLRFVTQMVAKGENAYDPEVDWMFVTYNIQPNFNIALGKLRMPLFYYSDFLDVSYAYQWIAAPTSVYHNSTDVIDGAKLRYLGQFGRWTSDLNIWLGSADDEAYASDNGAGMSWQLEREWLTLRAVYSMGVISSDEGNAQFHITELDEGLQNVAQALNAAYAADIDLSQALDDLKLERDDAAFVGVGAFMDFGRSFFALEATRTEADNTLTMGVLHAWYMMAGIRLPHNWSVSLTYVNDDNRPTNDSKKNAAAVYDEVYAALSGYMSDSTYGASVTQLIAATAELTAPQVVDAIQDYEADTYMLSTRWDFHPAAAFKAEYIMRRASNREDPFGGKVEPEAIRFAIDMVF